jgi:hypothetical protein
MSTRLPETFNFSFPMESERRAIRAIPDLITDSDLAGLTILQLVRAIERANELLWGLQFWIDDDGALRRAPHR